MIKILPFFLAVLLTSCGKPKQQLTILTWPNGFDPQIIAAFEQQFDCKVVLDFFNDDAIAIPKLVGGGISTYDIVCLGNSRYGMATNLNLLAPLRHENLPNFKNLDPEFVNLATDLENRFSIPYEWVACGLFARIPSNGSLEQSWALIFDPAKQPGPFVLLDEVTSCLGAALRYKGYSVNTTNKAELAEARDLLVATKKRSLGFQAGSGNHNRVMSGEAVVAMTWRTKAGEIMKQNPDVAFFIPREGAPYGIDSLGITSKAPHRDLAEAFLNYLMDAQVSLRTARYSGAPTLNKAARELLSQEERNNTNIYPPADVMRRLEMTGEWGNLTRLRDDIWTQIKAK
jgi:spermidine/putrescine transport system substrate-binding protein